MTVHNHAVVWIDPENPEEAVDLPQESGPDGGSI
ncbi:hypothetical protein V1289_008312 [Bradyrhizobium sp. AZCC 2289]